MKRARVVAVIVEPLVNQARPAVTAFQTSGMAVAQIGDLRGAEGAGVSPSRACPSDRYALRRVGEIADASRVRRLYRSALFPLSKDGVAIDHVLGAASHRPLRENEELMAPLIRRKWL